MNNLAISNQNNIMKKISEMLIIAMLVPTAMFGFYKSVQHASHKCHASTSSEQDYRKCLNI